MAQTTAIRATTTTTIQATAATAPSTTLKSTQAASSSTTSATAFLPRSAAFCPMHQVCQRPKATWQAL